MAVVVGIQFPGCSHWASSGDALIRPEHAGPSGHWREESESESEVRMPKRQPILGREPGQKV